MNRTLKILISFLCAAVAYSQNVPPEWIIAKADINPPLRRMNDTLDLLVGGKKYPTSYCTNLTLANSNRGYDLIDAATQTALLAAIDRILDANMDLGLKAIDVTIQYPILVNTFNNHDKYLSFYKSVFNKIRNKGFKIIEGVEASFIDTVWSDPRLVSDLRAFYSGLNATRYKNEKKQMIQTILTELRPDYLEMESEPGTQSYNLLNLVDFSPASVENYVRFYLDGLDRGSTLLSAGAGNWDSMEYFARLSAIPGLDGIDLHIYPVNGSLFDDRILKIGDLARSSNKKVMISECTLYKEGDAELGSGGAVAMSSTLYARDAFTFWKSEDSLFVSALVKYSNLYESQVTNYFWQHHFFQYVDYSPQLFGSMTGGQIMQYMQQQGYQNALNKAPSWFGSLFKNLISTTTGVTATAGRTMAADLTLEQNYPNPFNPNTMIGFQIPISGRVSLKIFDMLGREVATLVNTTMSSGHYIVSWNAEGYASGMYFSRLETGGSIATKKMILVR
jgi:hypothetical protein